MATGLFYAPRDAVFNQLCRLGLDDVVYKHVILYGVGCCLTLTCKSHLGEPGNDQVQKDNLTGELHFCQKRKGSSLTNVTVAKYVYRHLDEDL